MTIDYANVQAFNKRRFPNFVGVKENGSICSFELDSYNWEKIEKVIPNQYFTRSNRLNVYENGKITISKIWRNERNEEWEEDQVYEFKGKEKKQIKEDINFMLVMGPMSRRRDNLMIGNFEDLIKFLKKGDF